MTDRDFMARALALSRAGEGAVNPNPLVGAVVVRDGHVVGEGFHERFGGPHAEVIALDRAGEKAKGATLYVTLEPCCHHGKTPPCTERIIAEGVQRVVMAMRDPNPSVCGKGVATLATAGIEVVEGVLKEEAARLNEVFETYITTGRPFVHLKLAVSLDGRIATRAGDSKWISGEASRVRAHELRRRHAAILVGAHTVRMDDPLLDVRHVRGPNPRPVVLDAGGVVPLSAKALDAARQPILVTGRLTDARARELAQWGIDVWSLETDASGRFDLSAMLRRLGTAGIDSVLVEGGGETAAAFLEAGLVDRITLFIAPKILGGTAAYPAVGGVGVARVADAIRLLDVITEWIDDDLLYTARIDRTGGNTAGAAGLNCLVR